MGHRDKGYGSRGRRDRRPSPANWSSAAEFGDPTIDRPTPLTARLDRVDRQAEQAEEQYDLPGQGPRSASPGWESTVPGDRPRAGEFDAGRGEPYADEPVRRGYASDALLPTADPGWRTDYRSEPPLRSDSDPRRDYGSTQTGSYESPYRDDYRDGPRSAEDEPRRSRHSALAEDEPPRSRHSTEESPRRSLRALEEEARRAREESPRRADDDDPWRSRPMVDDRGPTTLLSAGNEGRVEPSALADPAAQPGWSTPEPFSREAFSREPFSRHYRDDADPGSWRTHQRTEFETWSTEDATAQRWRSETVSWRTHETIEVDTSEVDRPGPRAIGSAESAAPTSGRYADTADLEAWRSETGTWRTSDTATTGSWRLPPATEDVPTGGVSTDGWSTSATAETGLWSRSRGRWVPAADDTAEQADFVVQRYDDTGEIPKDLLQRTRDRILDHDEFSDTRRTGAADGGTDSLDWRRDGRRGNDTDWRRGGDTDRYGDDGVGRRVGRRRADDDFDRTDTYTAAGYEAGYGSGERTDRRSSGSPGTRLDGDRPGTSEWSDAGVRRPRRGMSAPPEDLDEGYRFLDDEPGRRSRSSRYDDDAPRYRSGQRSATGPRTARHSSDGYDDDDRRRPTRAVARRSSGYADSRGLRENVITPRAASRGELVPVGRGVAVVDEDDADEVDETPYSYASAGVASVAWFGLPIGAFLLWAMFLGGTARADCVTASGQPCAAPRDAAFATFATHLPQIGVAIALSVVVGLLIRRVSPFWRPATVGFAASVVGGGVTTILFTVLNS